jgi:hypothetical protein
MLTELIVLLIGCVLNFWCGWYFGRRDLQSKVGTPSASHNQSSPKLPDYSVIVKELESTRKSRFELTNENYIGMQLMYGIIAGKIGR